MTFTATIGGQYGMVKGRNGKPLAVSGNVTWSSNTGCGTTAITPGTPGTATCTTSTLGGGTDTVTATYSGDANHGAGTGSASQVVNQASQTITFTTPAPASAANGTSFTVVATATSGLAVAYTSSGACSNVGATYTMTSGTGSCFVIANQAGNGNYLAATSGDGDDECGSGQPDDHGHYASTSNGDLP